MDEHFQSFLKSVGGPSRCRPVPQRIVDQYIGRLPDTLLEYWGEFGWCAFGEGRLWLTNPADFDAIVASWLNSLSEWTRGGDEDYHVIARTAFGELFLWGEKSGNHVRIVPQTHLVYVGPSKREKVREGKGDILIKAFFGTKTRAGLDMQDEGEEPLFDRAYKKLGALDEEQMYALSIPSALTGRIGIDLLEKVDLLVHFELLRELQAPRLVDRSSL